jgi:hypothetical protein
MSVKSLFAAPLHARRHVERKTYSGRFLCDSTSTRRGWAPVPSGDLPQNPNVALVLP